MGLGFGAGDVLAVSLDNPSVTSLCFSQTVDMLHRELKEGQLGNSYVATELLKLLGEERGEDHRLGSWLNTCRLGNAKIVRKLLKRDLGFLIGFSNPRGRVA